MSARRAGLLVLGLLFGASGTATLLRTGYLALPAWRRGLAWGCAGLGIVLLLSAWRRATPGSRRRETGL
jgi:hypothetical protein